jgi:hypothetical protein
VNPAWISALVALICAVGAVTIWLARIAWRNLQRIESFLEDWNGSVESPGHPRRPGVLERLIELESSTTGMNQRFDSQDATLEMIKGEVTYNSGHSIKDTVRAILIRLDKFDPPTHMTGRKQ